MIQELPQISPKILRALESKGFSANATWALAGSAGSGRKYFRVSEGDRKSVV